MFSSITDSRKTIQLVMKTLESDNKLVDNEIFKMLDALNQVLDSMAAVNQKKSELNAEEITDTGNQGLNIIENLVYKLVSSQQLEHKDALEQISLVIAHWLIKHKGELLAIQSVVDALAYMANQVEDKVSLLQLSSFMEQVTQACSKSIKQDIDNSDPYRPWRALNMNRGIVATRTHDLDIMHNVFPSLIKAIPLDAPLFFKEGMSEMKRLNYPAPVQELMQGYYQQTEMPVRH